jgi:hypothetical protein
VLHLQVKILLGTYLFLRFDDLSHLFVEDLCLRMVVIHSNVDDSQTIVGIGVKVVGKGRTTPTHLML